MRGRAREYLSLRPEGLGAAWALYGCYLRSALARLLRSRTYITPGQYLGRPITVRARGLRFAIRPHSDDLEYALPGPTRSMRRWFRPGPGEKVIDVGAHNGRFTLQAARAGARVLSFEPNPGHADRLRQNLRLNQVTDVEFHATAAGPDYGRGRLEVPAVGEPLAPRAPPWFSAAGRSLAQVPRREIEVVVEPLDGVLRDPGWSGPLQWLLIDAEGSEAMVLEGASHTLRRTEQVLVEVVRGPSADTCRRLLARAGLMVVAREREGDVTEYWWARRDPTPVQLPSLVPRYAG